MRSARRQTLIWQKQQTEEVDFVQVKEEDPNQLIRREIVPARQREKQERRYVDF